MTHYFDRVTGRELTTEEARGELADWLQERYGVWATMYMPWLAGIPETPRARARRRKREEVEFFGMVHFTPYGAEKLVDKLGHLRLTGAVTHIAISDRLWTLCS